MEFELGSQFGTFRWLDLVLMPGMTLESCSESLASKRGPIFPDEPKSKVVSILVLCQFLGKSSGMNSYRSEGRREEEAAAGSENTKWTQRNDNYALSASSSNRELAQSAKSDSPYTPNQSSTPTSSSQPSAGPVKLSPQEAKRVAQTHFRALQLWLKDHSSNAGSTRSGARAKLEKLTRSQSAELSTDVFDEMVRRQGEAAGNSSGILPLTPEF